MLDEVDTMSQTPVQ